MLVKIRYDGTMPLNEIARFCGSAPCQILIVNGLRSESELSAGREILVPVVMETLLLK